MRALTIKTFTAGYSLLVFLARNLCCARKIMPFTSARFGVISVEPLSRAYLAAADNLYAEMNCGARLRQMRVLLSMLGPRFCLLARRTDSNEVVGMAIYYFNARDRREGTVHEGYIGLREAERSAGLGTFMRRHALKNFARSGLEGVSSRISVNNLASLKSNTNLGFVPVETYVDPSTGEERHYLVCDLRSNSRFHVDKRTVH
jgi:GNAT superfamily N-acetyltransferase